jgi:nucleotide-binding universal stress UspA family protein
MVMGLDNVLGVAGAAHGSFLLVVLGLLISIPILIWGSSMLLRFVERFPGFVYLGAGVLALTAAKMITAEPFLKDSFAAFTLTVPLLYVVTVFGVLWAGFVKNHRRLESRISARLVNFAQQRDTGTSSARHSRGEKAMMKILVPVDGSPNGKYAARHVIREFRKNKAMEVHLLNVQPPLLAHIARFVSRKNRADFHRDTGEKALQPVRNILDSAGVAYAVHIEVGNKAKLIAEAARRLNCDHIVMSTARKNSLTRMIEDSVTNQVLELTTVPVEVIAGDAVSTLERYGIPAGIGVGLALLALAAAD